MTAQTAVINVPVGTIVTVVVILAVTALVTFALRHRTVRMVTVAPLYGLLVAGTLVGAAAYNHLQLQRAYDSCIDRITRSDGNRDQHLLIYDVLDRELHSTALGDELRAGLDKNLPDRSEDECDAP